VRMTRTLSSGGLAPPNKEANSLLAELENFLEEGEEREAVAR
jgi:hypothetical protein